MPQLLGFHWCGARIRLSDTSTAGRTGRPWVCLRLQVLRVLPVGGSIGVAALVHDLAAQPSTSAGPAPRRRASSSTPAPRTSSGVNSTGETDMVPVPPMASQDDRGGHLRRRGHWRRRILGRRGPGGQGQAHRPDRGRGGRGQATW